MAFAYSPRLPSKPRSLLDDDMTTPPWAGPMQWPQGECSEATEDGGITGNMERPPARTRGCFDPFPGHSVSPEGADAHQSYAEQLPRDSDPAKTADFLKNVIAWNGDQGRGDVADLLGRFHQLDPAKATALQDELHSQTGERLPFRIAPVGEGSPDSPDTSDTQQQSFLTPDDLPQADWWPANTRTTPASG